MGLYEGALSPKPLMVLSNSRLIGGLHFGTLTKEKREALASSNGKTTRAPTAQHYHERYLSQKTKIYRSYVIAAQVCITIQRGESDLLGRQIFQEPRFLPERSDLSGHG